MGGNLALPFGQNLLQFGDRQFFLFEQEQDAEPVGIGQQPQRFED